MIDRINDILSVRYDYDKDWKTILVIRHNHGEDTIIRHPDEMRRITNVLKDRGRVIVDMYGLSLPRPGHPNGLD